jgi:Flp pilus assembly protein TadG
MKRLLSLRRNQKGVSAIEFALIAPALLSMLIGITQLGSLYFARADLRQAVAAGARQAQLFPRPTSATISSTIQGKMIRLHSGSVTGPTISYNRDANGFDYADIEVRYAMPLNFVVFKSPAFTMVERRRVFLQPTS